MPVVRLPLHHLHHRPPLWLCWQHRALAEEQLDCLLDQVLLLRLCLCLWLLLGLLGLLGR